MSDRVADIEIVRLNGGLISKKGLGRTDLKRYPFSAAIQRNWMVGTLGYMFLRCGLGYLLNTHNNNVSYSTKFIFGRSDKAVLEFTDQILRVLVDDAAIDRSAVSTAVTNGTFLVDLTGWTDADEAGTTSSWDNAMVLLGDGFNSAIRIQEVTVSGGDQNVEHALRIVITLGTVRLRVGSTSGDDDYINETYLSEGTHSLAFTPTGNFWIYFASSLYITSYIDSVVVEAAGTMTLPAPYEEDNLGLIRTAQSKNTIYVACKGYHQKQIERRAARSWSIVDYLTTDGPFLSPNLTNITLAASAINGNCTVTASRNLFRPEQVGALFQLSSIGQATDNSFSADNVATNAIIVTGTGTSRVLTIVRAGVWVATLTLRRSTDGGATWQDIKTYTGNGTDAYNDGLTAEVQYRVEIKAGDYTSGTVDVNMTYNSGSITGVVRIHAYVSPTQVSAIVVKSLGGTSETTDWAEGQWSEYRGYATAVALKESRLEWAGQGIFNGSVTDNFTGFDLSVEGDSGPISKRMGGASDTVDWMVALPRLILGTDDGINFVVSSTLEEALTPTNSNLKTPNTQAAGTVDAEQLDDTAIYVHGSGVRVHQVGYNEASLRTDSEDLTLFIPDAGLVGIRRIGVQRQPATRVHAVLNDGTALVLIYDKLEDLKCWVRLDSRGADGHIEDVIVMPGLVEDEVTYVTRRVIGGVTKRYRERFALEGEISGGSVFYRGPAAATVIDVEEEILDDTVVTVFNAAGTKIGNYTVHDGSVTLGVAVTYAEITPATYALADSYVRYSGVATTLLTGYDHLEGETVVVYADGRNRGTFLVVGGAVVLPTAVEEAVGGLGYQAKYKCAKYAIPAALGAGLTMPKQLRHLGLILADTHARGLQYGKSFNTADLFDLPSTFNNVPVPADSIISQSDIIPVPFNGATESDPRLCLVANAPNPACVLGIVPGLRVSDK